MASIASKLFLATAICVILTTSIAQAGNSSPKLNTSITIPAGQSAIIDAQENSQGLNFVEVADVTVSRVLPDDTDGRQHQKWYVNLANGHELLVVYNTDICDRVPVQPGQTQSLGGQYIWDRGGGLIHWVHQDPRHNRPDGYVEVQGTRYGIITHLDR